MSDIKIHNLSKRFASVAALNDISVHIRNGEFFGLLGPSGSGKTTLLRCIAGFVAPDSGTITFDDQDLKNVPTHRREVGMVFQNYALFPHMSVYHNIAFGLSVRHRPRVEISERVAEILKLVQLVGYEARRPSQLSGGQQQRVALARALISKPRVLLLDEPLGALDKKLRQQMQLELKQIQMSVGITAVFVTHDQEEALTLCDRIAVLKDGELIQVGPPNDVYEHPRTAFVADFLGATNFLVGQAMTQEDGLGCVLIHGHKIYTRSLNLGTGEVVLIVRPEKIVISGINNDTSLRNKVRGNVGTVSHLGSTIVYVIDSEVGPLTVFQQNRDDQFLSTGEIVALNWEPRHSVLVASG
jgi:spermidine/putrescine ABC transporter ATP-binding subunit